MSPRHLLLGLAAALFVVGLVLGLKPVSAGDNPFEPVDCGSAFQPKSSAGEFSDELSGGDDASDCDSAVSDAKPLAYGGVGLGFVALIGAFVASPNRSTRPAA